MDEIQLQNLLQEAQNGDRNSREKILNHFRSFVLNVASRISRRYVTWSDDESSIGLSALNKAIDRFNHKQGKSFLNFSYLLISREIIDFFRKETRHHRLLSLDGTSVNPEEEAPEESIYERAVAEREYELKKEHEELVQEILIYRSVLEEYGLSFDELPEVSPKHQDTRENCFRMARIMVSDPDLVKRLKKGKRLPVAQLSRVSGVSAKTIEKSRKYILAVTLLLLHPDLERLQTYIKEGGNRDGEQ